MIFGLQFERELQFWLGLFGILLATTGVVAAGLNILRRRRHALVAECATIAMCIGTALWGLKYLFDGASRSRFEGLSNAGFVVFMVAGLMTFYFRRYGSVRQS